ncbi:MAG: 50S ribosomal protein L13 [Oscillospiraceae bacterium]|nr:50S ribosomal protein L13 [Oscillospiraceae bacterium]
MSTTMAKPESVERKWFVIDAAGKPLGRVASKAASMLRGKHKVDFTPHVDCGDHIIIINCKDAILTGKKLDQKIHYWHTGWIGGIKQIKYSELMKENPQKAMTLAVTGMLPHNSLGRKMAKRLRTYAGPEHDNAAQKPEVCEF